MRLSVGKWVQRAGYWSYSRLPLADGARRHACRSFWQDTAKKSSAVGGDSLFCSLLGDVPCGGGQGGDSSPLDIMLDGLSMMLSCDAMVAAAGHARRDGECGSGGFACQGGLTGRLACGHLTLTAAGMAMVERNTKTVALV